MSDDSTARPSERGFEYQGHFYRWHVSDMGKDLMLVDRLTGLPINEFFSSLDEGEDSFRGPTLLALVATSMRHEHPDWSVERIVRVVLALHLSEIEFIEGDDDSEGDAHPPSETSDERSSSASNGSLSSSTPEDNSNYETSYATPA